MRVKVDGSEVSLRDGATLAEALELVGSTPAPGSVIGIIKGRGEKAKATDSYWLVTTKGRIRIDLVDSRLKEIWHESVGSISGLSGRWSNSSAVAFGDFASSLSPGRGVHEYGRFDVLLGAGGFEREKSQLIFVKRRHSAAYGVPSESKGIFARIVGGKNILDRLEQNDRILSVEPIVEWEDLTEKLVTTDMSFPLAEGMEVYSRFEVDLIEDAPHGAEFFLAATKDGTFKVDAVSSSYISTHILKGEPIEFEHREPRLEGTVTVRTSGRGLGQIFIYKSDRTSNPNHSVVGRVKAGMDLLKLASAGQRLTATVRPERFMVLGYLLDKAIDLAKSRGVEPIVEGYTGSDAVVIEQNPLTTMEVLRSKKVTLRSIPSARLVRIELYDDLAPKTIDYFRHVVGLKERPVGPLPVFFVYENTVLFKPLIDALKYKELLPENKPTGPVPAGSLGVTNQVAKRTGLIGVKFVEDKRYGPSGEKFEGTNIIGRVIDLDKLKDVREGETVYVMEEIR